MVNRIARIYPVYLLLTTIFFSYIFLVNDDFNLNLYLLIISFLRGYFDAIKFSGIGPGWSLTVEETFYLLAPLFFLLLKKRTYFLIITPLALIRIGVLAVELSNGGGAFGFMGNYEFLFNYTFFGRCSEFFIGMGLAIFVKKQTRPITFKYFTYVGFFIVTLCVYALSSIKGDQAFGIRLTSGKFINTFVLPLVGISVCYYGLISEKTLLSRFFSSKIMQLLGKSSYVFYLIHTGFIFHFLHTYFNSIFIPLGILTLISITIYLTIEEPMNKFIRKKFTN